jgi:hypothetical protein
VPAKGLSRVAEGRARSEAQRLLSEFGIERPEHIRLEDIAWAMGVRVVVGGVTGAAARLTHRHGRGIVRLRDAGSEKSDLIRSGNSGRSRKGQR